MSLIDSNIHNKVRKLHNTSDETSCSLELLGYCVHDAQQSMCRTNSQLVSTNIQHMVMRPFFARATSTKTKGME